MFDVFDPKPEDVRIEDIAHHLANLCRYTGACRFHFSVAQHSYYVSQYCDPEDALYGLLHDASEAYLNDVASPLNHTPEFKFYRNLELGVQKAILQALGLPYSYRESVKAADENVYHTERTQLMLYNAEWNSRYPDAKPLPFFITEWTQAVAKDNFLSRFYY